MADNPKGEEGGVGGYMMMRLEIEISETKSSSSWANCTPFGYDVVCAAVPIPLFWSAERLVAGTRPAPRVRCRGSGLVIIAISSVPFQVLQVT